MFVTNDVVATKSRKKRKNQNSMTETFAKIEARRDDKSAEPGMMPLGAMVDGSFVWIFEFGSLGFI